MEKELAIQFMTLYPTSSKDSEVDSSDKKAEVQFQESLHHHVEERDTIQSYIEVATRGNIFDMHYAITANPHIIDFDISNAHLTNTADKAIDNFPGFCVNIGAPRSVIGSKTLSALLRKLSHK